MAKFLWPATLPQAPNYGGVQRSIGMNKLSFKPDHGDAIERTKFTSVSDTGSMSFQMTVSQSNIFTEFYKKKLGYGVHDVTMIDYQTNQPANFHIESQPTLVRNAPDGVLVNFEVLWR
jgi:hypothetical protein